MAKQKIEIPDPSNFTYADNVSVSRGKPGEADQFTGLHFLSRMPSGKLVSIAAVIVPTEQIFRISELIRSQEKSQEKKG